MQPRPRPDPTLPSGPRTLAAFDALGVPDPCMPALIRHAVQRGAEASRHEAATATDVVLLVRTLCEQHAVEHVQIRFDGVSMRLAADDLDGLAGLPARLRLTALCDARDGFDFLSAALAACARHAALCVGPSGHRDGAGRALWCWVAEDGDEEICSSREFSSEALAALDAAVAWHLPLRPCQPRAFGLASPRTA